MAKRTPVVIISRRAAIARVRRKLAAQGHELHTRGGNYVIIDGRRQAVREQHDGLAKLALALGVLRKWERVAGE
jgi:hypothetical protein